MEQSIENPNEPATSKGKTSKPVNEPMEESIEDPNEPATSKGKTSNTIKL